MSLAFRKLRSTETALHKEHQPGQRQSCFVLFLFLARVSPESAAGQQRCSGAKLRRRHDTCGNVYQGPSERRGHEHGQRHDGLCADNKG